jgi:DNA invertase Pin-like site-specific DNA recombinase
MTIAHEYTDPGVSGTRELADRPALAALLDAVENGEIRTVLVERADRLARDLIVGEIILGQFRDAGTAVIAADSGADLTASDDDPSKRLIRQVLGAVAEYEKSALVAKMRAARERMRRETGRCEGVKPFGSLPGEAETLERIHQLRRKPRGGPRMGYRRIAKTLTAEGHPTRSGRPWQASTVQAILARA